MDSGCSFVYEAGKFVITIRKWQEPKTITQDRWNSYGSSWITGKDNQHADTPMAHSDDKDSEVKIISSTTSPEKPATKKVKVDVAPQPIPQRKRLYDEPGPNNTIILDLGGDGDCGYRSIAAAMALRSGKDLREVRENIVSLGKTIQANGLVAQAVAKALQTDILIFEKPDKNGK